MAIDSINTTVMNNESEIFELMKVQKKENIHLFPTLMIPSIEKRFKFSVFPPFDVYNPNDIILEDFNLDEW